MRRFKGLLLIVAILMVFAIPAFSKCYEANTWLPVNMGSSAWTNGGGS